MSNVDPPKDTRSFGEVSFNYESHDGRFVIGSKPWAFETSWSGAGQGAVHLYNDPVGIAGVAIAEGVAQISRVTPDVVAAADFTSRARMPEVGQIALLRNTAGFYAAVELLEVGYSSSPSANVMRLRFAICTDRTTDFSPFAAMFDDRQTLIGQLIAAASDAESALRAVPFGEEIVRVDPIGVGHNQPPVEFAITKDDQAEALEAIATIKREAVTDAPSSSKLRAAGQIIARVAAKVGRWIAGKADVAADEFAKGVAKAAGPAFFVWLLLQGKLSSLIDMLRSFAL